MFLVVSHRLHTCCPDRSTPSGNCSDNEVRLVNGSSALEGRVEVCLNNAWGTVCTRLSSSDDAQVICRQVGQLPAGKICIIPKYIPP